MPPDRPLAQEARDLQLARGNSRKERRFHNCSGKHAGLLAACTVAGWDTDSYLDLDHPIQQSIVAIVTDMTGLDTGPIGIDGCGAPTLRGTIGGLATAFSDLAQMKNSLLSPVLWLASAHWSQTTQGQTEEPACGGEALRRSVPRVSMQ